jgi:hypothetical protein
MVYRVAKFINEDVEEQRDIECRAPCDIPYCRIWCYSVLAYCVLASVAVFVRTRRLSCDISNIAIVNIFYRIKEKIINKIYFFKVRKINKIYRIFIYLFISDIFFTSPAVYSTRTIAC